MELDANKEVCGTCDEWTGKREKRDDDLVELKASAKGICKKRGKNKPAQGGCDKWTEMEDAEDG